MTDAPLRCPKCTLINQPDAQRCDCGHIFNETETASLHDELRCPEGVADLEELQQKVNSELVEAWFYAIFGLFCLGFILQPFAIKKAIGLRSVIRANPQLRGATSARIVLTFSGVICGLWIFAILAQLLSVALNSIGNQ